MLSWGRGFFFVLRLTVTWSTLAMRSELPCMFFPDYPIGCLLWLSSRAEAGTVSALHTLALPLFFWWESGKLLFRWCVWTTCWLQQTGNTWQARGCFCKTINLPWRDGERMQFWKICGTLSGFQEIHQPNHHPQVLYNAKLKLPQSRSMLTDSNEAHRFETKQTLGQAGFL